MAVGQTDQRGLDEASQRGEGSGNGWVVCVHRQEQLHPCPRREESVAPFPRVCGPSVLSRHPRRAPAWCGCGDGKGAVNWRLVGILRDIMWWFLPGVLCCRSQANSKKKMPIPPHAAELANEANSVFVDEDYDTALDLYTQVRRTLCVQLHRALPCRAAATRTQRQLTQQCTLPTPLLARAVCYRL